MSPAPLDRQSLVDAYEFLCYELGQRSLAGSVFGVTDGTDSYCVLCAESEYGQWRDLEIVAASSEVDVDCCGCGRDVRIIGELAVRAFLVDRGLEDDLDLDDYEPVGMDE